MKPYYIVGSSNNSFTYSYDTKAEAEEYRAKYKAEGYTRTYIKKVKGYRRLSDFK